MASKAATKVAGGVMSIATKQTVQSVGIWETLRRAFALDPNRSSGVPLNPYFRNPAPGALDPATYDDPVTLPAADIADNPYWKRDARRNYARHSVVGPADVVALLTVGSAAAPKQELTGEAGEKALVAAVEDGGAKGLAAYFTADKGKAQEGLAQFAGSVEGGVALPPMPSGMNLKKDDGMWEAGKYELTEEQSYSEDYPCRTFK